MKKLLLVVSFFALNAFAAPECVIDGNQSADSTALIALISGSVKGFEPGPVYITIVNGGKTYTTIVNREGKWALLYPSLTNDTQVLCWQGWTGEKKIEVEGTIVK
jgi:hypothetical protein